jgi:hypothetical protein
VFFGDYSSISAYDGRVVPVFMHVVEQRRLAVSVALFRFKPGTQELMPQRSTDTAYFKRRRVSLRRN